MNKKLPSEVEKKIHQYFFINFISKETVGLCKTPFSFNLIRGQFFCVAFSTSWEDTRQKISPYFSLPSHILNFFRLQIFIFSKKNLAWFRQILSPLFLFLFFLNRKQNNDIFTRSMMTKWFLFEKKFQNDEYEYEQIKAQYVNLSNFEKK